MTKKHSNERGKVSKRRIGQSSYRIIGHPVLAELTRIAEATKRADAKSKTKSKDKLQ